jgi:hypothetical protein
MKTRVAATAILLSLGLNASAQITKHRKYDWGWSYKLEMPETGLKCEFPEKPKVRTLAYGYMTAAEYKDELYIAAKLENPTPYDIACRSDEFVSELKKVHGLDVADIAWNDIELHNGNLTLSGSSEAGYASYHIDAIATEDVLTIFIYSSHDELSVPGHFFASSYSVNDIPAGSISYLSEEKTKKRAKILEYNNGRSLVRLENSPVTVEWPDIPSLEVSRHEAEYQLNKNGTHYSTRVVEVGPQVSYAFFNTFIAKENQKLNADGSLSLIDDETDVAFELGNPEESYFRKMSYTSESGTVQRYYVAADSKIMIQELRTESGALADNRFLTTFENSVRNEYDTRTFVSK